MDEYPNLGDIVTVFFMDEYPNLGDIVTLNRNLYFCRPHGSVVYLYNTLSELKRRRNRVCVAARRRVAIVEPAVSVVELDDCAEESDPVEASCPLK